MNNQNYRSEAHRIRTESRAKLASIRLARKEQRRSLSANMLDLTSRTPDERLQGFEQSGSTHDALEEEAAFSQEVAEDSREQPQDVSPTSDSTEDVPTRADDPLEQYAAQSTIFAPDVQLAQHSEVEEMTTALATEPEPHSKERKTSDLMQLPGAADGLVWMLEKCGIRSLAELAVSDADDLTKRLGVVGQIVNVSVWIDFAKQRAA